MGSNNFSRALALVGSVGAAFGLTIGLTACNGFQSPDVFATDPVLSVSQGNRLAQENTPSCIIGYSDFQLDESLVDFTITSTTGVDFGFNISSSWINKIGLNLKMQKSQMDMSMTLAQTADPQDIVANAMGSATSTNTSGGVDLDLVLFKTSFSSAQNTPLATTMANTVKNGLANIKAKLAANPVAWSSPIVYLINPSHQFIIPAGAVAGMRLGDQFQVYNIDYSWAGDPCNSKLLVPVKTTTSPVALAQVVQVEENASLLQIYDQISTDKADALRLGSRVYVQSLPLKAGEKSRSLLNSLSLRNIVSSPLELTNGSNVNLVPYFTAETLAVMSGYGFYPRN